MDSRQKDDTAGSEEPSSSSALTLRNNNSDSDDDDAIIERWFSRFQFLRLSDLMLNNPQWFEFKSHLDNKWNFICLDEAGTSLVGWETADVLDTSAYDYYHVDELDTIIIPWHKDLIAKGHNTSPVYRFRTKGNQWVWLETTSFIHYCETTNKPEYVCCNNRVVAF